MKERNWNIASNTQLEEECKRLEKEFEENKKNMSKLHEQMVSLSEQYCEVKEILNKRQGRKNG